MRRDLAGLEEKPSSSGERNDAMKPVREFGQNLIDRNRRGLRKKKKIWKIFKITAPWHIFEGGGNPRTASMIRFG